MIDPFRIPPPQAELERLNSRAAESAFRAHNRPAAEGGNRMDLHGLHVREAESRVAARIREMRARPGRQKLVLVVGRGLHSEDGVLKIGPAMIDMARK